MDGNPEKIMQYVNTGKVSSGGIDTILNSGAIGSCIAIIGIDSKRKVGAMAHVMLPGKSPSKDLLHTTRYADNAIEEMLNQLNKRGIIKENITICLVGGANVLKREKDTIGKDNLDSIERILQGKQIKIKERSIGGFERRTVLFDIERGCIYYTVGDSK